MNMVESINLSPEDRSTTCSDMSRGPVPMECASPLTQLEQLFKVALTGMSGVGEFFWTITADFMTRFIPESC